MNPVGTQSPTANRSFSLAWLWRPSVLILFPVLLSFFAWLLPVSDWTRHGWQERSDPTVDGVLALLVFYTFLAFLAELADKTRPIARKRRAELERLEPWLICWSVAGLVAFVALVSSRVDVAQAIGGGTANQLDAALPDEAGWQTLRYAVVPFAAISLYRIVRGEARLRHVYGIIAVLIVGLASGRLLFAASLFTAGLMLGAPDGGKAFRIRARRVVIATPLVFLALVALTYPRVSGTYAERGITNPLAVTSSSLVSYLTAAPQVQLVVADGIMREGGSYAYGSRVGGPADLLLPTFLRSSNRDGKVAFEPNKYGVGVDTNPRLTTNSVFADVSVERGPWGLLPILMLAAGSIVLVQRIRAAFSGPVAGLLAGPLLYPLSEIWRANLFLQGSQIAILLTLLSSMFLAGGFVVRGQQGRMLARQVTPLRSVPSRANTPRVLASSSPETVPTKGG